MKSTIHTALLNRTATIRTGLHLPKWTELEGLAVTVVNVYITPNHDGPQYSVLFEDGTIKEVDAYFLIFNPA